MKHTMVLVMTAGTGMVGNGVKISMNNIDCSKNCHDYCPYRKLCKYVDGAVGLDPDDCAMYYKLEDIMNDARDIEEEVKRHDERWADGEWIE